MKIPKSSFILFSGLLLPLLIFIFLLSTAVLRMFELKDQAFLAQKLQSSWNSLDRSTNDLLLRDFNIDPENQSGFVYQMKQDLIHKIDEFDETLTRFSTGTLRLIKDTQIQRQTGYASRLWNLSLSDLKRIEESLDRLQNAGLGKKIRSGNLLERFYYLRMLGQLNGHEIIIWQHFINSIKLLDRAGVEFDKIITDLTEAVITEVRIEEKRLTILVSVIGFLFLLLLFLFFYLYKKIQIMERERSRLAKIRTRRNIRELLWIPNTPISKIITEFKALKIPFDFDGSTFSVLIMHIASVQKDCIGTAAGIPHSIKEEMLQSVIDEFRSSEMPATGIIEKREIIILYQSPSVIVINRSTELIEKISPNLYDAFQIRTYLSPGSDFCRLDQIPELYRKAKEQLNYKILLKEDERVIRLDKRNIKIDHLDYNYPYKKELLLTSALKVGQLEKSYGLYLEIIDETTHYSHQVFTTVILLLITAVNNTIILLRKTSDITKDYDLLTLISELNELDTISEINRFFFSVFKDITRSIHHRKQNRLQEINGKVKSIIEREFRDPNLSAELIADMLDISVSYLTRLFRQINSMSIQTYINDTRLKQAEILLLESRDNITDIAAKVGISNGDYFYTMFKKKYSLTPSRFRKEAIETIQDN